MCKFCRHKDLGEFSEAIRRKYDLDSVFAGDLLACLKVVTVRIRELKKLRSKLTASGNESTYKLDCELSMLRFGARVLNQSREDERKGKAPWLNGYRSKSSGHKGSLFL